MKPKYHKCSVTPWYNIAKLLMDTESSKGKRIHQVHGNNIINGGHFIRTNGNPKEVEWYVQSTGGGPISKTITQNEERRYQRLRAQNSSILLVGMQDSRASLENSLWVSLQS